MSGWREGAEGGGLYMPVQANAYVAGVSLWRCDKGATPPAFSSSVLLWVKGWGEGQKWCKSLSGTVG